MRTSSSGPGVQLRGHTVAGGRGPAVGWGLARWRSLGVCPEGMWRPRGRRSGLWGVGEVLVELEAGVCPGMSWYVVGAA